VRAVKKKELQEVPIADLIPYQKKIHDTAKAVPDIVTSLEKYDYIKISVVVDENMQIICGNGVLQAMQKLGWTTVPQVTQVIGMPEVLKREYRIADNQTGARSNWNLETLLQEIEEIKIEDKDFQITDLAITQKELDQMIHDIEAEKNVQDDDFDPEKIRPTDIQYGDLYELGPHRLLCGDSTKLEDLQRLMGGAIADMTFTDPPYNVDYQGKTKARLKIKNDRMAAPDFYQFLLRAYQAMYATMKPGAPIYVCHSDSETIAFRQSFMEAGFQLKQCIIWVKDQFVLGRQDYHWRHEPILEGCKSHDPVLYGWKDGAAHRWLGGRCEDTVWEVPKPKRNADHPTMKPIPLVARAVLNSSNVGDIVQDAFGGLGATLMAAEQTGRVCYTNELDPHYCQGIIDRWEAFTGKTARKITA
jgi:DNA modification methylase